MDEGYIDLENFHKDFHLAITAQNKIRRKNIFVRKRLQQQWLILHDQFSNNTSKHSQSYVWGTSIIEMTLRLMIDSWMNKPFNNEPMMDEPLMDAPLMNH